MASTDVSTAMQFLCGLTTVRCIQLMTHWNWTAVLLGICAFCQTGVDCNGQLLCITPNGQLTDLAISDDDGSQLFVSAIVSGQSVVYRLNGNLTIQEALWLTGEMLHLGMALTPDGNKLVTCARDRSCTVRDASDLNNGSSKVFENVLSSSDSVALVSAHVREGENSFFVGSSNGTVILIGQYGLDGPALNLSRASGDLFLVTATTFYRKWFGGFLAGCYAYFVVLDVNASTGSSPGIRVLRVCNNINETLVTAMSEIELDCLGLAGQANGYAMLAGASIVSYPINGPASSEATLLLGIIVSPPTGGNVGGTYRSGVCAYPLSQIDARMDNASTPSPTHTCTSGALPWRSANDSTFECSSGCNMSSPGATAAPKLSAASRPVSVPLANTSYELNYVLSIYTESLTLMFIASTNQLGDSVLQAVSRKVHVHFTMHSQYAYLLTL